MEKPGLYVEGLHLTTKGYEVWAEAMDPLFKKLNA
jgi:lysophospholipase L1-like esterase